MRATATRHLNAGLPRQGSSGEVHCEKVTCPVLTCTHPVRRNPSDCCKECPEEEKTSAALEHSDMMQADGPRHCKFGKNFYQNSDNWHPWVPLVGEMKCINCWCDVSNGGATFSTPHVAVPHHGVMVLGSLSAARRDQVSEEAVSSAGVHQPHPQGGHVLSRMCR